MKSLCILLRLGEIITPQTFTYFKKNCRTLVCTSLEVASSHLSHAGCFVVMLFSAWPGDSFSGDYWIRWLMGRCRRDTGWGKIGICKSRRMKKYLQPCHVYLVPVHSLKFFWKQRSDRVVLRQRKLSSSQTHRWQSLVLVVVTAGYDLQLYSLYWLNRFRNEHFKTRAALFKCLEQTLSLQTKVTKSLSWFCVRAQIIHQHSAKSKQYLM